MGAASLCRTCVLLVAARVIAIYRKHGYAMDRLVRLALNAGHRGEPFLDKNRQYRTLQGRQQLLFW